MLWYFEFIKNWKGKYWYVFYIFCLFVFPDKMQVESSNKRNVTECILCDVVVCIGCSSGGRGAGIPAVVLCDHPSPVSALTHCTRQTGPGGEAACWALSHVSLDSSKTPSLGGGAAGGSRPRRTEYPSVRGRSRDARYVWMNHSASPCTQTFSHAEIPADLVGLKLLMDVIYVPCSVWPFPWQSDSSKLKKVIVDKKKKAFG